MEKSNELLYQELRDALDNLSEKIYNLVHYGSYKLESINRNYRTQAVDSAIMRAYDFMLYMRLSDEYKYLESKGTEVTITLPNNPIDQKVIDAWDSQSIDDEIAYHKKTLKALEEQRSRLQEAYEEVSNTR